MYLTMRRYLSVLILGWAMMLFGETFEERYGPQFYGVELPETGARVLLIIDRSKSMGLKESRSKTANAQTRWERMLQEVESMTERMVALSAKKSVSFAVAVLYEGGGNHLGSDLYYPGKPKEAERLLAGIRSQTLGDGGNFPVTFGEHLWPLVTKAHMTHVFFLGDKDIDRYESEVMTAVNAWYSPDVPGKKWSEKERKIRKMKQTWQLPWARTGGRIQGEKLPPLEGKDLVFHCIALTSVSKVQTELAEIGHGQCVSTRLKKKK